MTLPHKRGGAKRRRTEDDEEDSAAEDGGEDQAEPHADDEDPASPGPSRARGKGAKSAAHFDFSALKRSHTAAASASSAERVRLCSAALLAALVVSPRGWTMLKQLWLPCMTSYNLDAGICREVFCMLVILRPFLA